MEWPQSGNGMQAARCTNRFYQLRDKSFVGNPHQSYPQHGASTFAYHRHHQSQSSLGSDSSAPGLVEDKASEASIEEEEQQEEEDEEQGSGIELWDSYWQAQSEEQSKLQGARRQSKKNPSVSRVAVETKVVDDQITTSPSRAQTPAWPLPDAPIGAYERSSRPRLRAVASYSVFPKPRQQGPARACSRQGTHQSQNSLSFSQPRLRPPPLHLKEPSDDRPQYITRSNPVTPPLLTSQSDPSPLSPRRNAPQTAAPTALRPLNHLSQASQGPQQHQRKSPLPFLTQDPHPVSVFEDSDNDEGNDSNEGFASRLIRRGLHKRSASETRRGGRGSEVAAAQLRRARGGNLSVDGDLGSRGWKRADSVDGRRGLFARKGK